jgi:hypothetical protein
MKEPKRGHHRDKVGQREVNENEQLFESVPGSILECARKVRHLSISSSSHSPSGTRERIDTARSKTERRITDLLLPKLADRTRTQCPTCQTPPLHLQLQEPSLLQAIPQAASRHHLAVVVAAPPVLHVGHLAAAVVEEVVAAHPAQLLALVSIAPFRPRLRTLVPHLLPSPQMQAHHQVPPSLLAAVVDVAGAAVAVVQVARVLLLRHLTRSRLLQA